MKLKQRKNNTTYIIGNIETGLRKVPKYNFVYSQSSLYVYFFLIGRVFLTVRSLRYGTIFWTLTSWLETEP